MLELLSGLEAGVHAWTVAVVVPRVIVEVAVLRALIVGAVASAVTAERPDVSASHRRTRSLDLTK